MNLFCFDIDGTILNDKQKGLSSTKKALKLIKKNNDQFILATGRPELIARKVATNLNASFLICSNGAAIFDYKKQKYLIKHQMSFKEIEPMIELFSNYQISVLIYGPQKAHFYLNKIQFEDIAKKHHLQLTKDELNISYDKNKMIDDLKKDQLFEKMWIKQIHKEDHLKMIKEFEIKFGNDFYWFNNETNVGMEIGPKGIDKWNAIQQFIKLQNLQFANIITFGDEQNDYKMIQKADFGVAVANSTSEIKKVANYITKSNNNHGIYFFIKKFYQNKLEEVEHNR